MSLVTLTLISKAQIKLFLITDAYIIKVNKKQTKIKWCNKTKEIEDKNVTHKDYAKAELKGK